MLFFFLISLSSIFSKVKPKSVWKLPNRMSAPLLKPWASVGGAQGHCWEELEPRALLLR